jgi:hypothetical protein
MADTANKDKTTSIRRLNPATSDLISIVAEEHAKEKPF